MRTVIVRDAMRITLGKQGENNAVRVVWAGVVDKYAKLYGEGHFELVVVQRGQAYPAVVNVDGADLVWDVRAADTATAEVGSLELIYYAGDTIVKSKTWETVVVASKSADGMTEPPEDPARAWFDAIKRQIGDLSKLTTKAKENLVAAINEAATTGSGGGSVEMRVDGGYIQYSTDGVTWENLISVASLEGKPGKDGAPGETGPQGSPGSDGKTAYQYAQDGGYTGSETEFAAKLAAEHLPVPATAAVGQYFKAKAVDENGVVTEVEAVDAPTNVSTEDWVQIVDLTVEDTVNSITNSWPETPMKKIRVLLETVAYSENTNYMPTTVCTALDANIYFHSAQFYPTALPLREARHTEYLVAMMKVGEYNAIRFTEYLGGIRGVSSEEKNIFKLGAENSAVSTGNNAYGASLLDYITAFKVATYGQFEAGTKLKIWGVPA